MSAPRGWNRPVRPAALLAVSAATVLLWLGAMVWGGWTLYRHWEARVWLRNQALGISLPQGLQAHADIQTRVETRLDAVHVARVPFRQEVSVQIPQALQARAQVRTTVPVDTQFTYQADIPVSAVLDTEVPLVSWLPRLKVQVPVSTVVPVRLTVPIRAQLPLVLDVRATGRLKGPLRVPVDTVFAIRAPVRASLAPQVQSRMAFTLLETSPVIPLFLEGSQVRLPLRDVSWERSR